MLSTPMFTGIIERTLRIAAIADGPHFRRLTLPNPWPDVRPGESIALNGVCLTVAEITPSPGTPGEGRGEGDFDRQLRSLSNPSLLGFDVIAETLSKTNLGLLTPNDPVNIERSLKLGDRLDGHFVQGHVDGTARLLSRTDTAQEFRLTLESPPALAKYLIPKGSVTLDGVSLTIAKISSPSPGTPGEGRGEGVFPLTFDVALIPTTLTLTTLADRPNDWPFNLECDVLSKTIISHLERQLPNPISPPA